MSYVDMRQWGSVSVQLSASTPCRHSGRAKRFCLLLLCALCSPHGDKMRGMAAEQVHLQTIHSLSTKQTHEAKYAIISLM